MKKASKVIALVGTATLVVIGFQIILGIFGSNVEPLIIDLDDE